MSSTTYEWIVDHEDMLAQPEKWQQFHGDKPALVFTPRQLAPPAGADVRFVSGAVADMLPMFRDAAGDGDIWVVGGGDLAGQFLDTEALDEIRSAVPHLYSTAVRLCSRGTPVRIDFGWSTHPHHGQFARLVYSVG